MKGEEHELKTYESEYRNLMALLYDRIYKENFGECKGMGRCGTCVVTVKGLPQFADELQRNEERTLYKLGLLKQSNRLACQILVNANLQNVTVEILGSE